MSIELTSEQSRAVERRGGSLLVRAGAGTGKTSVLVERFVQAVVADGAEVQSLLAITFTEKAAAEMKARVRSRLQELGLREQAREAEAAWISTIHGFCSRVLRTNALTAGIDPEYRVLDELESERIGLDAFDRALEDFLAEGADPERLELVAAYTPDKLRAMVRSAWSLLRSRGERRPELPVAERPAPAGERERLEAAASVAAAELASCAGGLQVDKALDRLGDCRETLAAHSRGEAVDAELAAGWELKGQAKALRSSACEEFREAQRAYAALCLALEQYRDRTLLRQLLDLYGERYESRKRDRGVLDFEDLELIARDLFRDHPGLRDQYAGRFAHVLVDEFQDVNPLQNELLGLLERDNLFRVGDENQSIYGFRNADVGVFREHHERARAAGRADSITVNFRSRGELLDAIDLAFGRLWGEDFEPLRERPDARRDEPKAEPCVDLLVVDKDKGRWDQRFEGEDEPFGRTLRSATQWRACEARLLAKRVDELTRTGPFEFRDVVLLLRAGTHMAFYERALEERGIPTHVVGGRGYWSQQQVGDVRHWLAALANPLDELALYSVLASPLVGASLDAVALVALHARRDARDPWWEIQDPAEGLAAALSEPDRERIAAFARLFAEERRAAPRVSLETLVDRAVTRTGYDRRTLSLAAGDRRMANVRKLMRMAREFEAEEGRDLRRFIDFVAERDLIQEREGEAPLEAEQLDAVRLMTIHRAKGLEFPVVCVADLGKDGREDHGALRISEDGSLGLRLARLGGGTVDTEELSRIKEEQRQAGEDEERRILYVALTRAREHLVLSGAADLRKDQPIKPLCEPMRWLAPAICAGLPERGAEGIATDAYEGRKVRVRWRRCSPDTLAELLSPADLRPTRPAPPPGPAEITPPLELGSVPAPRALPVSRLSYSGLSRYQSCGYRFYLERVLRLPALRGDQAPPAPEPGAPEPPGADELPALLRGTVVHELLEGLDMRRPVLPSETEVESLLARHDARARPEEVADLRALVEGFVASPLRERLASARRVRSELPFAFTLEPDGAGSRSLLVNGVVDVHAVEDEGTLVVDYKSDRLEGADPVEYCEERYAVQRLVYALAALRAGALRVEVAYVFLERPAEPVASTFEAADAGRLEAELEELARGLVEGRFEPTSDPHLELCHDCPGRPALCSWDQERTMAPRGPLLA